MPTVTKVKRPWMPDKPKAEANQSRGGNADTQWYRNEPWVSIRRLLLEAEPLCRKCKSEGGLTPATMVDHIVPFKLGGAQYDESNLQPLCAKCHAKKSQSERRK